MGSSVREQSLEVRPIAPDGPDRLVGLHLALEAPLPTGPAAVHPRVADFLADAAQRGVRSDLLLGVYLGPRLVSAALAVESPGRAALVLTANAPGAQLPTAVQAQCLEQLMVAAFAKRNLLLQLLLPPGSAVQDAAPSAGFRRLTRLLYLQRPRDAASPANTGWPTVRWLSYSPPSHPLFVEAIRRSYAQSMDCPELTGIRPIDDVLAGHRAAGQFDPQLWSLALQGEEPVGVILLSPMTSQAAVEVVYMGVAQVSRGAGVAHVLLDRAVRLVSAIPVAPRSHLALAVDERNRPARGLYARWGFTTIGFREAWIATSSLTRTSAPS